MNREGALQLTQETEKPSHPRIFLLALVGLLTLRIPFLAGMGLLGIEWEWTGTIFDIGTYLLTAFLIWWEVEHLSDYHIDRFVLIIVILFKPIQTLILSLWTFLGHPLAFPKIPGLLLWLIALVFALGMWQKRSRLPAIRPGTSGWIVIGILAGLFTTLLLSYPMSLQIPEEQLGSGLTVGAAALSMLGRVWLEFPYQIGYAAVTEEPLFRGFLWGYLRKLRWPEVWI